jgi:hypothetical protein
MTAPKLKSALDAATALLTAKGAAGTLATLKSVGGFNIRKNANNNTALSNHSFGWAVDLDPALNPNTQKKNLPLDLIQVITTIDLYGPESQRLRTSRPYDQAFPDAEALSKANKLFVDSFSTLAKLKTAWIGAIKRLYTATLSQAAIDKAFDLAGASPPQKSALQSHLGAEGVPAPKRAEAATFLINSVALFRLAQKPGLTPQITGSQATVTRFGFFNLPPEIAAALVASDGGSLNWLGAALATKDYMHFDLRPANQPALV